MKDTNHHRPERWCQRRRHDQFDKTRRSTESRRWAPQCLNPQQKQPPYATSMASGPIQGSI